MDDSLQPRPLRGIIYLSDDLEDFAPSKLNNWGGSIGHEVGHYWLVPGAAKIQVGDENLPNTTRQARSFARS